MNYLSADDGMYPEDRLEISHGWRLGHTIRVGLRSTGDLLGHLVATYYTQWTLDGAEVHDEEWRVSEVFLYLAEDSVYID